ncbi:MAG: zinc-ribbon domain-containing protein [Deltaproteobacteria bacterium]|nr:zinc-ribbon domain-containing protein [Deltaproteobacteria bacterium]
MKFVCDSCHAQYLISDEKVGPNGVIVRCKKCQHKIVVKRASAAAPPPPPSPEQDEATIVSSNPMVRAAVAAVAASHHEDTASNPIPSGETALPAGIDDELGRAFESVMTKQGLGEARTITPVDAEMTPGGMDRQDQKDRQNQQDQDSMPLAAAGSNSGELTLSAVNSMPQDQAVAPLPAMNDDFDSDRQSTRVMNLSEMAGLIKTEAQKEVAPPAPMMEEKPKEKKNGSNGSSATAGSPAADWFVAINDSQVGPLSLEGVRERWDKGELSADSLCWKPGMNDWRPLSGVSELAEKLAPRPAPAPDKEVPAGAVATGAQALAPTPLPPQQDEPGEPEWKPSAANALESLVKDELEALQRPVAKKPEYPPEEELEVAAKPRGLIDDLPEMQDKPESEPALSLPAPAASRHPILSDEEEETSGPAPVAAPERRSRPPQRVARPEFDEQPQPQLYVPPPRPKTGLYILLGVGLLVLCGTAITLTYILTRPQQTMQAQPQVSAPAIPPVAQAVVQPPAAGPTTPATSPAATAPTKETNPNAVAAANPPTETPKAEPVKPPVEPAAADKAEPKTAETKGAEVRTKAGPAGPREPREQPRGGFSKVATREPRESAKSREAEEIVAPKEAEETGPAVKPLSKSGGQVDDDFDKIFGNGGGNKEPAQESPKSKPKPKDVWVPPAPGAGAANAKAQLEQSDVMEVVVANRSMIKNCVDEAKAKEPGATGTIVMRWTIKPDGSTGNIQTVTEEFRKTPLSACLAAGIKSFRFPSYTGPQMSPVNFPFKF